ncbi:CBS domain-containing protein [Maridesulfovibrio hydrothermalis]|uniref:CBS domain containing protein n=1 Tax=Maridesulfovibrio hydrothermalis AM13 = DSM 14728 TaxID=1121451 RepID=L0RAQ5_9BACT|nr:CBS domain-containing protein [Maridesulfovibrio hydrothermalis]CCO23297.1 CBS domain containing protein [Maridesulfovibrio hydrothermalis AM13 = DSM 14728]
MKNLKAKDLMIPASEYCRVKKDTTLFDAMQFLVTQSEKKDLSHPHRDLLVEDEDGKVIGKVTMLDIFQHMEPAYFKVADQRHSTALSKDYVQKVYTDFNLWSEPLSSLCQKSSGVEVKEVMHTPKRSELVDEEDSLDKALHAFVLGVHQPLLVQKDGVITGVLRLGDAFEKVRTAILACEI